MKRLTGTIGLISALFLIQSCATIIKGTDQLVTINSNVDGAKIYLEGVMIGETPFTGKIKKNKETIRVEKEGYKAYTLSLSKQLEPMFWGNIITGGTLGSITDFASGAAYAYSPSSYQVELFAEGESTVAFSERFELRRYAIQNISNISIDLGNNKGDYLDTLIELAKLPHTNDSVQIIREKFNLSKGNEIIFGKEITKLMNS